MKQKLGFLGKAVLFVAVFCLVMSPVQAVLARKSLEPPWDMTNKVGGFYNEPEEEFEVMFFGSSHAYAAFSPLKLWQETGVKSYVFATQQQPLWATYFYLREALKTQSPSLVVVECNMAMDDREYFDDGVTYSYMDELPLSWNKARLAWVSATDLEGRTELLLNIFKYHGRWSQLTEEDWEFDRSAVRDPYKGYVLLPEQAAAQTRPEIEGVTQTRPLTEKNEHWLREIMDLCSRRGIRLWLVKSPSNVTPEGKQALNAVAALAEQAGVTFTDFNEDYAVMGLTEQDFYDASHLDGQGAARFTAYFGAQLMEQYPDLPRAPEDSDWAADLARYLAALEPKTE